jgi:hypothetical protein
MSALGGSDPAAVWDVLCDAMLTLERPDADLRSQDAGLDAPRR